MRKTIEVVAAVIFDAQGSIFATQRGYGEWKDWWEFPGGKIEPGETPQQALHREIREELDADIEVGELLRTIDYDYPTFHLRMHCFRCRLVDQSFTLLEHEAARWLAPQDLLSVRWLPADIEIINELMRKEKWQWQEPGTAWRGVGLYHITLTVTSRQPLLGTLVIPNNDPAQAHVDVSPFGRTLTNLLWDISKYQPDIQMLHYALMPDHLHFIWYVKRPLTRSIREVVSGFWVGAKKLGRAYSYDDSSFVLTTSRHNYQESLCDQIGKDTYYALDPIFTQMPHIQPMGHNSQLPATIDYLDMNPQRLATKRLRPGFFRVQPRVEINGRVYAAIGSSRLLHIAQRTPVHVRHTMTEAARLGNPQPLNDYIASCYDAARQGSVMVSPFISSWEKDILHTLLQEKRPIIYLAENGFKDYYKPSALLFDAVANDRLLILSPWPYDPSHKHVSRADCIALNAMAEEICAQ